MSRIGGWAGEAGVKAGTFNLIGDELGEFNQETLSF